MSSVTVEQAAINALGAWLARTLGAAVTISTQWPEPTKKLPAKAVTILRAGPPEEEPLDPIIVGRADTGPHTSLFTWRMRALLRSGTLEGRGDRNRIGLPTEVRPLSASSLQPES